MRRWFTSSEGAGVATLGERLDGLAGLMLRSPGSTVLDLGCGEGLIARSMLECGAIRADAVGVEPDQIDGGERLCADFPIRFHIADLGKPEERARLDAVLEPDYDVVLALAVLNKIREPAPLLAWAVRHARKWIAIRVPAETFTPKRCDHPVIDVLSEMAGHATLVEVPRTNIGWLGIFEVHK